MAEINLLTDLFLCPVAYDEDTCDENGHPIALPEDDMELHFTKSAAEKIAEGAHIVLTDAIPNTYSPAKTADKPVLE